MLIIWSQVQKQYDAAVARYTDAVRQSIVLTEAYLRFPAGGYWGRTYAIYIDLMAEPEQVHSRAENGPKLNFGSQAVGSQGIPPQAVAVYNTGDAPLSISTITLAGTNSADFSLQGPLACTNVPIPPGDNCSFEVGFVPSLVGPEATFVTFTDNAPPGSQALEAIGSGSPARRRLTRHPQFRKPA